MKFPLIYISEIEDEKERQEFWDQGISLDDYDYILLFPPEILIEEEYEEKEYEWQHTHPIYNTEKIVKKRRWILSYDYLGGDIYTLANLLNGCYENKWYKAKYQGQEYAIGVAYHG